MNFTVGLQWVRCMDDELILIKQEFKKDKYGVSKSFNTFSDPIKCKVSDVYGREFFEGGRNGLNPEFQFVIFAGDYEGESSVKYNGQTYAVYRHYHRPGTDYMELYVQREGGTNGIQESDGGDAGG